MKNFYSLLMCVLVSLGLSGQSYYMLPAIDAGFNPGNLNTDPEQPAEPGWNDIMLTTTTDTWSSAQTIPFSFSFNGTAVSSFVVSNSGVLTFSTTPGTAPSSSNAALPSGIIPDKSVCVWGLKLTGTNDKIRSKTFGSAPNRQHWISWTSASHANLTGASNWTYWSIVLEETTNKIYIVDQRTYDGGNNVAITGGIQVSTTDFVQIPGSPALTSRTTATSANGADVTDNTFYEFSTTPPLANDIAAIEEDVIDYVTPNTAVTLTGLFRNMGLAAVSSADFNYTVNGGTVVTTPLVNVSFSGGQFVTVSNSATWTPTTAGLYQIEMWLSNVNGAADPNPANDKITAKVVVSSTLPERRVLIEERTGTWCGWCPRGAIAMEYMSLNHHETTVLVAVHNGDPMTVSAYDGNLSGAFPTYTQDRIESGLGISSGSAMASAHTIRRGVVPAASIEITNVDYQSNGTVTVDVEADFIVDETNADYRFALIYKEDGVTGTGAGYGQVNYYSGGGSGPMVDAKGFNYATAPATVPAADMVYHHVARAIEPSFSGAAGSVPSTLSLNQKVSYTFNSTLPSTVINENHVHVAVILLNNNNGGEVVNADEKKLTNVVSLDELDMLEVNVYPNPASDYINIELYENKDFSVELVNSIGQVVLTDSFTKTDFATINTSNLAKGVYFLKLNAGDQTSTMRIAITK